MKTTQAKQLIVNLYQASDPSKPISKQISLNFTPSFYSNTALKKNSLLGRIASIINFTSTENERNSKVGQVFAEAFAALMQAPDELRALGDRTWRSELYRELHDEIAAKTKSVPSDLEAPKELEELLAECDKTSQEALRKKQQEIHEKSLLRDEVPAPYKPTFPTALFDSNPEFNMELLESYIEFLKHKKAPLVENLEQQLDALAKALKLKNALHKHFFPKGKPLPVDVRETKIESTSQALQRKIAGLNTQETLIFFGSYGRKEVDLEKLFSLLKLFPKKVLDKIPSDAKALMGNQKLADPTRFVEDYVHEKIDYLASYGEGLTDSSLLHWLFVDQHRKLPKEIEAVLPKLINSGLEKCLRDGALQSLRPLLASLLRDDQRHLPESIAKILPAFVGNKVEGALQAGPIELLLSIAQYSFPPEIYELLWIITQNRDLMDPKFDNHNLDLLSSLFAVGSLVPYENAVSLLQDVVRGAHLLSDVKEREKLRDRLTNTLKGYVTTPMQHVKGVLNDFLRAAIEQSREVISPEFLDFLGFEQYLTSGNLWVEFVKQSDGRFTVHLYTGGRLLAKHPRQGNDIQWPLKIQNIAPEKINARLFSLLLKLQIEPEANKDFAVSPEDIWTGLVDHLQGSIVAEYQSLAKTSLSEQELAHAMVLKAMPMRPYSFFDFKLESLIQYCKPLLTGQDQALVITDQTQCAYLEKAVQAMLEGASSLKQSYSLEHYERVMATFEEINQAIADYRLRTTPNPAAPAPINNPLHLSEQVLNPLRYFLQASGLDGNSVKTLKPVLAWALGDEIEGFLDAIIETMGTIPATGHSSQAPVHVSPKIKGSKGWLRDFLQSFYFQMAMSALKIAISAIRIYQNQFPAIILFSLLRSGARSVVPAHIYEWVSQVFNHIMRKSIETTIRLILWMLLNPKDLDTLYACVQNTRHQIHKLAQIALGKNEISYDLTHQVRVTQELQAEAVNTLNTDLASTQAVMQTVIPLEKKAKVKSFTSIDPLKLTHALRHLLDKNTIKNLSLEERYRLFTNFIKKLPVPKSNADPFWDQVPNTDNVFTALSLFTKELYQTYLELRNNHNPVVLPQEYGELVVLFYSVQTGMDYLAKRRPELNLANYTLSYCDLLGWMIGEGSLLSDPTCQRKLSQILDYYQIDLNNLPKNDEEIRQLGKKSLFYYYDKNLDISNRLLGIENAYNDAELDWLTQFDAADPKMIDKILENSLTKSNYKNICAEIYNNKYFLDYIIFELQHDWKWFQLLYPPDLYPEANLTKELQDIKKTYENFPNSYRKHYTYLEEVLINRLQDPDLKHRYPDLYNLVESKFVHKDIFRHERLDFLFAESEIIDRPEKKKILPTSYVHLRQHVLLSSVIARKGQGLPDYLARMYEPNHKHLRRASGVLALMRAASIRNNARYFARYASLLNGLPASGRYIGQGSPIAGVLKKLPPRTQADITADMDAPHLTKARAEIHYEFRLLSHNQELLDLLLQESVLTEKADSIMRLIGYLRRDKNKLASPLMDLLDYVVFHPGNLLRQLRDYPQTENAIFQFIQEQFQYHLEQKRLGLCLWLIYFGLRVKRCCLEFGSHESENNLELLKLLDRLEGKSNWPSVYYSLKCLIIFHAKKNLTPQEKVEGSINLFLSNFAAKELGFVPSEREFSQYQFDAMLVYLPEEIKVLNWERKKHLHQLLSQKSTRHRIIRSILQNRELPIDEKTIPGPAEDEFVNGNIILNPFAGTWRAKDNQPLHNVQAIVRKIRLFARQNRISGNIDCEVAQKGSFFYLPQEDVYFKLVPKQDNARAKTYQINALKIIDGVTYKLAEGINKIVRANRDVLFPSDQLDRDPHLLCWMDDKDENVRDVFVQPFGTRFKIHKLPDQNKYYYKRDPNAHLVEVALDDAELGPLSRFVPLESIKGYAYQNSTHLCKLSFPQFALDFIIKEDGGKLKAYSDEIPGYWIAPSQFHPQLNNFGSYLLLVNEEGKSKVLLPADQWSKTFISRFLSHLGTLGSAVLPYLPMNPVSNSYFVYQLENNGLLTAESPEALVQLIMLYLIQGNEAFASKACTQFENLARLQQIDLNTYNRASYLLLCPMDMSGARLIRSRLAAAIEENMEKHQNFPDIKEYSARESVIALVMMVDLNELIKLTADKQKLNEYQEWFIFQGFFRRSFELIKNYCPAPLTERMSQLAQTIGWEEIIENLAFSDRISSRYKKLKKRFGQNNSAIFSALGFAKKVASTPSFFPTLGINVPQTQIPAHYALNDDSAQQLSKIGKDLAWSHYFDLDLIDLENLATESKQILYPIQVNCTSINAQKFKENFLAFCLIALADRDSPAWHEIKEMLPLIRIGWDKQTRILIKYLEAIMNYPFLFWKPYEFIRAFEKNPKLAKGEEFDKAPFKEKYPYLTPFFEHLNNRVNGIYAGEAGVKIAAKKTLKGLSRMMFSGGPGLPATFMPKSSSMLINWGSSLAQVLTGQFLIQKESEATREPFTAPKGLYAALKDEDDYFDQKLDHLFDLAFESIGERKDRMPLALLENNDANYQTSFDRANQSLSDYWNRPNRKIMQMRLKSEDALFEAYAAITCWRDTLRTQIQHERAQILNLFGKVSFEELLRAYLYGEYHALPCKKTFTPDEMAQLELTVTRHLIRSIRLQQIERILNTLQQAARINPNTSKELFDAKLEQLSEELKARRAYNFGDVNMRLARRLLLFEYGTGNMVWEKQYQRVRDALIRPENDKNLVIVLLMSLGKTYFCIPTLDSYEANGKQIIFNVFPAQTFETNVRQISRQGSEVYYQNTNVFRFARGQALNQKNPDVHTIIFQRALEQGETINLTPEYAKALELMFLDQMDRYRRSGRRGRQGPIILKLNGLLRQMRRQGALRGGDEAHELLATKKELSYPIGSPVVVKENYYLTMEECFRHLAKLPKVMELIKKNETLKLTTSPEIYKQEVVIPLANYLADSPFFDIDQGTPRKEFIDYICGQTDHIPHWIQTSDNFDSIALVRGVLNDLMELALSREVDVDFGASKENRGEGARPYSGNSNPIEQSTIRLPYEAFVKTFIQFLNKGLDPTQIRRLRDLMLNKAKADAKKRMAPLADSAFYKRYASWLPKDSPHQLDDQCEHKDLAHSTEAILHYIRYFVRDQIKYWKYHINSGAQDLAGMFASAMFDTGTPYNFETYPAYLKVLFDPETIGEAIHIMREKCPADGVHELEAQTPSDILDEVLARFFHLGSGFTALIDGSALLKGISNDQVAQRMLTFIAEKRPDIQAVAYFTKDEEGRDRLVCLQKGATLPEPFERCSVPAEKRLSYFDQSHGFAADIPQVSSAKGLNLIGEKAPLYRIMQEVFRMRGIKKWKKLMGIADAQEDLEANDLSTVQTIHFAFKKEIKSQISGNKPKTTVDDIVAFAIKNEQKLTKPEIYSSYPQKAKGLVRRAALDRIEGVHEDRVPDLETVMDRFDALYDILVNKIEDAPKNLFGFIKTSKKTLGSGGILEQVRQESLQKLKASGLYKTEELRKYQLILECLPTEGMPEEAVVYTDGKVTKMNVLEDLNKELTLTAEDETSTETENETQNKTENNRENELQSNDQVQNSLPQFKEASWHEPFNPHQMDWLTLDTIKELSPGIWNWFKSAEVVVTGKPFLFSLQTLIGASNLKHVSPCFDKRIWVSNNFLPTIVQSQEDEVQVGSRLERELYQLLVHFREPQPGVYEIESVGCLSQKDAVEFRKRFLNYRPTGETKAVLYDTQVEHPVAGAEVVAEKFRQNADLQLVIGQLRLLNGDVYFPTEQKDFLVKWARAQKTKQLKEALLMVQAARGVMSDLTGTDLEEVLVAADNLPRGVSINLGFEKYRKSIQESKKGIENPPPYVFR